MIFPAFLINWFFTIIIGSVMVRWGINRNNYRVSPGLYAVGTPDNTSDVFVSANYKLSFDNLRKICQESMAGYSFSIQKG